VPYVVKDVSNDYAAAMDMIRRSGQQGVPVITTDDEVIVGFDQVRLAKIAERFAGPKRPPLGLLGANADAYLARHPDAAAKAPAGTKGVYVGEIRPDSVAQRAGLRPGDIIAGLAGKRVRDMAMLDQMIDTLIPGDAVDVRYLRDGEEQTARLQF
jgi:S1-C subfamily serine protease